MSVEFLCIQCHSQLQVSDPWKKSSQCPHCGEIQTVPQGVVAFPPHETLSYEISPDILSLFVLPLTPTRVRFGKMFQNTLNLFFAHFGIFLLIGLIVAGVNFLFFWVSFTVIPEDQRFLTTPFNIIGWIVRAYLYLGFVRYILHLAREGKSRLSILFPGLKLFLKQLGASILVILAFGTVTVCSIAVGFILALGVGAVNDFTLMGVLDLATLLSVLIVIPVFIWLTIRLMWHVIFIADRNEGPIEAIVSSWQFSRGNVLSLFGLMFIYGIIGLLVLISANILRTPFFLICAKHGIIIPRSVMLLMFTFMPLVLIIPLIYCCTVVAYLMMTGQSLSKS